MSELQFYDALCDSGNAYQQYQWQMLHNKLENNLLD